MMKIPLPDLWLVNRHAATKSKAQAATFTREIVRSVGQLEKTASNVSYPIPRSAASVAIRRMPQPEMGPIL
jgi:hypothetical protein